MLKLFVKFMFSKSAMEELYKRRKALQPSEQNRNAVTITLCSLLFLLIMGFLMSMSWTRRDAESFIENKTNITPLTTATWDWSTPILSDCRDIDVCEEEVRSLPRQEGSLDSIRLHTHESSHKDHNKRWLISLKTTSEVEAGQFFFSNRFVTFVFPQLQYHNAFVYINHMMLGLFRSNERIAVNYDRILDPKLESNLLDIEIFLILPASSMEVVSQNFLQKHWFDQSISFMPMETYNQLEQYVAAESAGRGDFIGYIARIVMAVFVLALFLLVDGSPETLGLGLFMGFEAFAMSLTFDWLPIPYSEAVKHYCYQMGDLFRLYFFLQLARVIDKDVFKWFVVCSVVSIPYGILRQFQLEWGLEWPSLIPDNRDMVIGLIGTAVCFRSAYYLKGKHLPWRVIALCVAGVASLEHCFYPLGMKISFIAESALFAKYVDIFQPLSAYLLAYSAFINISTMENRVKTLSIVEAKHREIKHEMELGKTVQEAFLQVPSLPDHVSFCSFHEAMLYVSGDTYFVNWNEKQEVMTFLINDVTGHGVQAALKASGVNVIANTLWLQDKEQYTSKLEEYSRLSQKFFKQMNHNPDILAMGAVEMNFKTGYASFFRVNFPFPIIIEPKLEHYEADESRKNDHWRIRLLATANETITHYQLRRGSFVILYSDGFIDNSRATHEFLNYLRKHLGSASLDINSEDIRELMTNFPNIRQNPDDCTINICQWTLDEQTKRDYERKRPPHPKALNERQAA